jgi:hypothetical protein
LFGGVVVEVAEGGELAGAGLDGLPGCREHSKNVKRWRDWTMALRWCAAGMLEAGRQFRRVNGHLHLPRLRAALDAHFAKNVSPVSHNENQHTA